jgi:trk system potassium uptake protein TrkH
MYNLAMISIKAKFKKMQPGRKLIIGFATIIFIGAILLYLPISHFDGQTISLVDSFFISFSAVCVTGLSTIDIGGTLSIFGSVVLATLIQLGGIGFASFALFFLMLVRTDLSFSNTQLAREALNSLPGFDIRSLVKTVIVTSLSCEIIGTGLSYLVFRHDYSTYHAFGISVFHAISSFNNAGFDLLGDFKGLVPYQSNVLLNLTTSILIIVGGLGFFVIHDFTRARLSKNKKLKFHTKIVLSVSAVLIFLGTIGFYAAERGQITLLQAFFQSVTARTAGFNTMDISQMKNASIVIMIVLMFIGASPGSTGGGIKTTTLFTIFLTIFKIPTHHPVQAFYRKISDESILKAFIVATFAILVILFGTGIIFSIEGSKFTFEQVLFECVSAFATVGLSMGVTTQLSISSKFIIMALMFIGRLGPLTIAYSWRRNSKNIQYVEENILIG